jgi:hypothetical protein
MFQEKFFVFLPSSSYHIRQGAHSGKHSGSFSGCAALAGKMGEKNVITPKTQQAVIAETLSCAAGWIRSSHHGCPS